jgi:cytochrome bd-type quinol oxidase subunit 2
VRRSDSSTDAVQELSLEGAATHLLEECRMVLPGIQALFGFQFVAVFSAGFSEKLSPREQHVHLVALLCVAAAAALVMAPAAVPRQTQPRSVSERFLSVSSRLLMWSMPPLAVGTCLDVYLVARVITGTPALAVACATLVLVVFVLLWAILPRRLR